MSNPTPLPDNARCVFKGALFEIWQWKQRLYDGSLTTFERLKRPDTAVVIPIVGANIIVLRQEQPDKPHPFLSLPGGRLDPGENPLKAAKRELLEESGYYSDDWKLWQQLNPVGKIIWTVHVFIARNCRYQTSQRLDAGEKISVEFISFDNFLQLSDDSTFYEKELLGTLLRCRYIPGEREKFYTLLFNT